MSQGKQHKLTPKPEGEKLRRKYRAAKRKARQAQKAARRG